MTDENAMGASSTLDVRIVNDVLTIRIGVDALGTAVLGGAYFEDEDLSDSKITDARLFAAAVLDQLVEEDELGSTCVYALFDTAAERAIENGAEGIALPEDQAA